jgi:hypothetical protein
MELMVYKLAALGTLALLLLAGMSIAEFSQPPAHQEDLPG